MKENIEKKLANFAKTENWRILKRVLEETADNYYSWNVSSDKLPQSKGAQDYKDMIIRLVEGAEDALTFKK